MLILGVPTAYIPHARPNRVLSQLGLDGPGIAASIFKAIEHMAPGAPSEAAGDEVGGSAAQARGVAAAAALDGIDGQLGVGPLGVRVAFGAEGKVPGH